MLCKLKSSVSRLFTFVFRRSSFVNAPNSDGIKVLWEPEDGNPAIDIVAIHGLNGHYERTWQASNGVNWLSDLLPSDIRNARILTWGYDANTHSLDRPLSRESVARHARSLVSDIVTFRRKEPARPIIFVAHSLGGIVLKSALIHSNACHERHLSEQRSFKISTHGIIFMGTPHSGGNGAKTAQKFAKIASLFMPVHKGFLQQLEKNSSWLEDQQTSYNSIAHDIVTKYAYEQYKTCTVMGRMKKIVPYKSAIVLGHANAESFANAADHVNMVKFTTRDDAGYKRVSDRLADMALAASENIRTRWMREEGRDSVSARTSSGDMETISGTTTLVPRPNSQSTKPTQPESPTVTHVELGDAFGPPKARGDSRLEPGLGPGAEALRRGPSCLLNRTHGHGVGSCSRLRSLMWGDLIVWEDSAQPLALERMLASNRPFTEPENHFTASVCLSKVPVQAKQPWHGAGLLLCPYRAVSEQGEVGREMLLGFFFRGLGQNANIVQIHPDRPPVESDVVFSRMVPASLKPSQGVDSETQDSCYLQVSSDGTSVHWSIAAEPDGGSGVCWDVSDKVGELKHGPAWSGTCFSLPG